MSLERVKRRGQRVLYSWNGNEKLITELLQDTKIVEFLERSGPLTEGTRRNALRRGLENGTITPDTVPQYVPQRPIIQHIQQPKAPRGKLYEFNGKELNPTEILQRKLQGHPNGT